MWSCYYSTLNSSMIPNRILTIHCTDFSEGNPSLFYQVWNGEIQHQEAISRIKYMLVLITYSFRGCGILLEGAGAPRILNLTEKIEPSDPIGAPNAEQRFGSLGRGQGTPQLANMVGWSSTDGSPWLLRCFFPAMLRGSQKFFPVTGDGRKRSGSHSVPVI